MVQIRPQESGNVPWARKVNGRWIVHHGLRDCAEAYLNHLEACDPTRMVASCDRAHRMVHGCEAGQDPKPWFYAGLFSLATAEEVDQFLADHWFTAACVPAVADRSRDRPAPHSIGPETRAKIERVREALAQLS